MALSHINGQTISGLSAINGQTRSGLSEIFGQSIGAGETFPLTSILDNFNRANENPIAGGWASFPVYNGINTARVVSNTLRCRNVAPAQNAHPVWNTTFAANQEAYVTVSDATVVTDIAVLARATDMDTPSFMNDMYYVRMASGNFRLYKVINDTETQLATTTQALSSGDSLGIRCNGTTIQGWYKPSGGSWTKLLEVTDSSLTGSGNIAIMLSVSSDGAGDLDDFGGGEI